MAVALMLCLAALIFAQGCSPAPTKQPVETFIGPTMGTSFTVKVVDLAAADVEAVRTEIEQTLRRIDQRMSTYRPDSELSRLNRLDRTDWTEVSGETAWVIEQSVHIGRLTGGAFDVTVGPLVDLWQFGPGRSEAGLLSLEPHKVPSDEAISRTKSRTGLENLDVRLEPPAVRKKWAEVSIDLSGIAKGFAVDRLAEILDVRGLKNYMVEVGGEVKAKGRNHLGRPWRIGIESPVVGRREIQRAVALDRLAMATSGDYRNYFEEDGVRYSHIIDPRSGRPVSHKLASVTVLDRSCTRADALATALMVLGPEAGYELAVREKLPVMLIVHEEAGFVEKATPEFEKAVQYE